MLEPVLAPLFGGGPAGVVEVANMLVANLLVGVVVLVWPAEDAFKPALPKENGPVLPP